MKQGPCTGLCILGVEVGQNSYTQQLFLVGEGQLREDIAVAFPERKSIRIYTDTFIKSKCFKDTVRAFHDEILLGLLPQAGFVSPSPGLYADQKQYRLDAGLSSKLQLQLLLELFPAMRQFVVICIEKCLEMGWHQFNHSPASARKLL